MKTSFSKRTLWVLAFVSAFATAQERIGYIENPPWLIDATPTPTGILPDLTALLFADVTTPTAQILPPRRLRAEMAAGTVQWTFWPCHMAPTEYLNLGVVMKDAFGYAVRVDANIHQHRDLQGKTVGVWASRLGLLPALEQDRLIKKVEFNSMESALLMLKAGRIDAVVSGLIVFRWKTTNDPAFASAFAYVTEMETKHCLFVHPSVGPETRERLRLRLQTLVEQGVIEAAVERWLVSPISTSGK